MSKAVANIQSIAQ